LLAARWPSRIAGSDALPIQQAEHRAIELGKARNRDRQAPPRQDGTYVVDDQVLDHVQDEARGAPAPAIGAQPLQIVLQQRLAHGLIGVLPVLMMVVPRQHAGDHAPHVLGEEGLECTPATRGVEREEPDRALRQQIAHHERHVDPHPGPTVIALEPHEAVGAQTCHHLVKRFLGLGIGARDACAGAPCQIGCGARQGRRGAGVAAQCGCQRCLIRIERGGHGCPVKLTGSIMDEGGEIAGACRAARRARQNFCAAV